MGEEVYMFLCMDCGAVFEEPNEVYDVWLEHFGYPCRKMYDSCPKCYSDNIVKAKRCGICGEYLEASKLEEGFCPQCALKVIRKFDDFLCMLTKEEKKLLNAKYYGMDVFV